MQRSALIPNRTWLNKQSRAPAYTSHLVVLIKARMTAIGPYVVVFWTLSQLVLVRECSDAAFGPYSQSNMVEQAVTCSCIHQSPGHRAQGTTYSLFGCIPVTRVELEFNLGVNVVACWRGD